MGRLLEVAAKKAGCPHFGLEVGKKIDISSLGLVGQLMRNAPTVGAALLDFASHQHRNAHGAVVYVLVEKHHAFFGYAVYQPNVPGNDLICDGAAMGGCNIMCELVASSHKHTMEFLLSRSEPQDKAPYEHAFCGRLRFNAGQTAVALPKALLDYPVANADANLRTELQQRVATVWHAGPLDILTRLRRELRVALMGDEVSGDEISARMGMSRRTLHRRLEAYGIKFQQVLEETRCEFAEQLLANTRLSVGQIATIVGHADPSILTRGFVRWTGLPPTEWRSYTDAGHLHVET